MYKYVSNIENYPLVEMSRLIPTSTNIDKHTEASYLYPA